MPPLLARCIALFLVLLAIALGRHVLRADPGNDRPERAGHRGANATTRLAAKGTPTKIRRTESERSRTTATIHGFLPEVYYDENPELAVEVRKLPPGSQAHVRCYRMSPDPNPKDARIINGSVVVNNGATPQSYTVMLRDINDTLPKEGHYTVEVVHKTGQGTTVLYHGMIRMNHTFPRPGGNLYTRYRYQ